MAVNPPIQQPMIGPDGRVTPVWNQFFLRLSQQIGLSGYMLKSTYDPNGSGSVVDSDKFAGELPAYYLDLANATGLLRVSRCEWNIRQTTVDISALAGDHIECDASGGAINVTLPDPNQYIGRAVSVCKADSSGNAVTVIGTVNGAANPSTTTQYTVYWLLSVGAEWRRI